MKPTLTAGLLALMMAATMAPVAMAQPAPEDGAAAPQPPRDGRPDRLAMFDTDGDGTITREEAEGAAAARFARIDADGDGGLTLQEMTAYRMQQQEARMAERFAALDLDGDGALSPAELPGPRGDRIARTFERFDADGDGAISPEERARRPHGARDGGKRGPGRH